MLVNNAANDQRQDFLAVTEQEFDWTIAINLRHVYFASQAIVPQMRARGGGSIVNLSSVAWMRGIEALEAYTAAKAAIVGFTNSLAQRVGRDRIRVNAIAPGFFESEMTDQYPDGYLEAQQARIPAGRKGDPRELAATAVFLASPAAGYITGQTLPVDGGMTIT